MTEEAMIERVTLLQLSMERTASDYLSEGELDNLRCLIRVSAEVHNYLRDRDPRALSDGNTQYICETIFSGVN